MAMWRVANELDNAGIQEEIEKTKIENDYKMMNFL